MILLPITLREFCILQAPTARPSQNTPTTPMGTSSQPPPAAWEVENPFSYRWYYYDTETGFYYLQSRYYNLEVSRFINADVVMNTNSFIGTNVFAYCFNNPANCLDDTGYSV